MTKPPANRDDRRRGWQVHRAKQAACAGREVNMSALTRWNPFRELEEMQRRMAALLDWSPFRRSTLTTDEETITVPEWSPLVDIIEDDKEYLLKVELPEVSKDDVKVTVEGNTLTISGERKAEKEEKNRKYHRVERFYGRFAAFGAFAVDELCICFLNMTGIL
jgi:HSP20 family protein